MTPTAANVCDLDEIASSLCTAALGDQYEVPIDLQQIALYLGVRIAQPGAQRLSVDGRLVLRSHDAIIEHRSDISPARQRFTIAHELGHAFLLHPRRAVHIPLVDYGGEERFCNQFAAALLLPRRFLATFAGASRTLKVLFDGARNARSSAQALSRSLFTYGYWETGLLSLRNHGGEWAIQNWAGVPPYKLADLSVSPRSAKRLHELAAGDVPRRLRLELISGHRVLDVEGEARVDPVSCSMLAAPPPGWRARRGPGIRADAS